MTIRVGINGFGRIGRNYWRAVHAASGGGQGGAVVGAVAVGQFPSPDERVDRVVIGEADREDDQQDGGDGGDPRRRRKPLAEAGWHGGQPTGPG